MVQYSRCFIAFSLLQDQLALRIHCKYPAHRNAHLFVSEDVLEEETKNDNEDHFHHNEPKNKTSVW